MKRILLLLLLIAAAASASCKKLEKDTYLSIDKYMIEFNSEDGIRTLELTTNGTPSVVTPSWVSHQIENSGDEQWTLVLKCTENTTSDVRNGILRVESGNAWKAVSLRQNQKTQTTPDNNTSDPENNTDGTEDVTPQVISDLLSMNGKNMLYSISKTDRSVKMTYLENWISGRVPAADDLKVIEVPNDLLRGFADEKNSVIFYFATGGSSKINVVDFPMEVVLDKESISTEIYDLVNGGTKKDTVNFTVICPRPELVKIDFYPKNDKGCYTDCWSYMTNVVDDAFTGNVIICQNYTDFRDDETFYFTLEINNRISSTNKTVKIPYYSVNNQPGITKEEIRKGLVALYNACNGKSWANQKNWLSNKDITEWEGVEINENSELYYIEVKQSKIPIRVFSVDLESNNLSGTIPAEFWNICGKGCEGINFSRNDLTNNTIPSSFWGEFIGSINFNQTNIEVSLDDAIKCAKSLSELNFKKTKCIAPTKKFFDTKFPCLRNLFAEFATPSPLPDNMVNFKYNAPELFMGSFENVISYPNNLNEYWTHVYWFYINGKKVVNNPDVVGPGDSIFG